MCANPFGHNIKINKELQGIPYRKEDYDKYPKAEKSIVDKKLNSMSVFTVIAYAFREFILNLGINFGKSLGNVLPYLVLTGIVIFIIAKYVGFNNIKEFNFLNAVGIKTKVEEQAK